MKSGQAVLAMTALVVIAAELVGRIGFLQPLDHPYVTCEWPVFARPPLLSGVFNHAFPSRTGAYSWCPVFTILPTRPEVRALFDCLPTLDEIYPWRDPRQVAELML